MSEYESQSTEEDQQDQSQSDDEQQQSDQQGGEVPLDPGEEPEPIKPDDDAHTDTNAGDDAITGTVADHDVEGKAPKSHAGDSDDS